jgi:antibiotic biosynthesis monooxygenase (ABM) superfamily enzyme
MNAMVFKFDSLNNVKSAVENKDINISIEVYKQIKKAFYSKVKRNKVTAFSIQLKDNIVDFELGRDQWKQSLTTCMDVFAVNDMFEECIEIQKILKEL